VTTSVTKDDRTVISRIFTVGAGSIEADSADSTELVSQVVPKLPVPCADAVPLDNVDFHGVVYCDLLFVVR